MTVDDVEVGMMVVPVDVCSIERFDILINQCRQTNLVEVLSLFVH